MDKSITIQIYKIEGSYYGKIISSTIHKLKGKINEIILIQMIEKNKKTLYGGGYFDYNLNKECEAKLKLKDANTIKFTRKYGLFNKKSIWHRVL